MTSDGVRHILWNPGLEQVLKDEAEQSQVLYWLHNRAANRDTFRDDIIMLPSIILSAVTGFLSATTDMVPQLALGAISIGIAVLNTIGSRYKFSQRAEAHRMVALMYMKAYKNIQVELLLPVEQRQDPEGLLKDIREKLSRIGEIAPPLPTSVIKSFKKHFPDPKISVPIIANGLDEIEIFRLAPAVAAPARPIVRVEV